MANKFYLASQLKLSSRIRGTYVEGFKILDRDEKIVGQILKSPSQQFFTLDLPFVPEDVREMNKSGFNSAEGALEVARVQFQSFWDFNK